MAKIWQISDGRSYVVNGDPGTTITYTNSPSNGTAAGKPVTSIPTGATSVTFPSNGSEVEISSDTATIDQVFNAAAAGSGSSSSGSGSAGGVTFQIVTTLPNQGAAGVIYLVKVSETGDDRFEEWIWVDSAWESIGTTAVDPTTYAKLIGGNTFEGNQVINGDLTVTGDVSGVTESNYNVVETAETTITPTGGTWVRYTGSETSLTVVEPGWDGEAEISYLETATPVDLQGVTWSPAKPILTGNGPFVYALVHAGPGQMLAGAYGYSVATAEAVQAVVPMAFGAWTKQANVTGDMSVAIGEASKAGHSSTALGYGVSVTGSVSVGVGSNMTVGGTRAVAFGHGHISEGAKNIILGVGCSVKKDLAATLGVSFTESVNGVNISHTCTTEGTGSITIGAGANTLNNGDTESSNSVTIGCKAENKGADSVVIGAQAKVLSKGSVVVGAAANGGSSTSTVAVGASATAGAADVALGFEALANQGNSVALGFKARAFSAKNVALGSQSTITNTTAADGTVTKSENTTVIGYGASASAPNAVVLGAGASTAGKGTIIIGAGTSLAAGTGALTNAILIGTGAKSTGVWARGSIALGANSTILGDEAYAIGGGSSANTGSIAVGTDAKGGYFSNAIGFSCVNRNNGTTSFRQQTSSGETYTQFYIMAAESPLAVQYEEGEACMGYVVKHKTTGELLAAGTQKLSVLFPNNSTFQPAVLGLDDEYVAPKVFHPSDLDMPQEEPTEPEDVEITIPEPEVEEYQPLPVYPIVEPEVPEILGE